MIESATKLRKQVRCFRRLGRAFFHLHSSRRQALSEWTWFGRWRRSLQPGRSPVNDRVPWVTFTAQRSMERITAVGSRVFEYGVGGSTLYFLDKKCKLTSVEHNPEWFHQMRELIGSTSSWTPLLHEPEPIGPDGSIDDECRSQFPGYEDKCFRKYVEAIRDVAPESLDLVMVDGRARVDAGLAAIPKIRPGGWLVLDNSERERYAPLRHELKRLAWHEDCYRGPGPYVDYEFWQTTLWRKPAR